VARIIGFPNPVNEVAARAVAGQVLTLTILTIVLGTVVDPAWLWLSAVLAAGFALRVLSGPRFSPFGQLATRVLAPAIGHEKPVAGPPKRFAQAMGLTMGTVAVVLQALGLHAAVVTVLALVVVAATLESVFGYCLGCKVFALGMRLGWVPEQTCEACANIALRHPQAA
jgi:hypothetical protein